MDSPIGSGLRGAATPALEAAAVSALGAPPVSARHPLAGGAGTQLLPLHHPPAALHQHVIAGASIFLIVIVLCRVILLVNAAEVAGRRESAVPDAQRKQ